MQQKQNIYLLCLSIPKQDIADTYRIEPDKITVTYNAANALFKPQDKDVIDRIKTTYTDGKPYFVYVGAIHARKNINRLLQAFDQFKRSSSSETKFLVVGEATWDDFEVDDQIKDVVFTGHVGLEKLVEIVGSAQALCLVSYFEGFGIPLVEAMQSGVPILAGNLTSLPEISGNAGLLVDPFNVDDITNAMERIDSDKTLRSEMIELGFQQAQKFSWDESAKIIGETLFS